jgi:hypothetical protein
MFICKISYKESGKVQKVETTDEDVFNLLKVISKFNDLDITEIHITKDVI